MLVTLYIILTFDNEWHGVVKWAISGIWVLALQLCCILLFLLVVRVSKFLGDADSKMFDNAYFVCFF